MNYRMFRTAHHPEFVRMEIEPALAEAEMPTTWAPLVADLIDKAGHSVASAIDVLRLVVRGDA